MKRTADTASDLRRSVIAVPPRAWAEDGRSDPRQNRVLVGYLEAGGVSTVLYGGHANIYDMNTRDYRVLLESFP